MTRKSTRTTGDPWDEHYRGTRYRCSSRGELSWKLPAGLGRIRATAGFEKIVDSFLSVRRDGGSLMITETRAVITKVEPDWSPVYIDEYDTPLEFEHVDVLGLGCDPLDIWPSFYDGARYSYKQGRLWWKNPADATWQETREKLPGEVKRRLLEVKPDGGSLRFTENGKILTLIEAQPLPKHWQPQYNALNDAQKRLIARKVQSTSLLPVLLGEHHGGFTLHPLRSLADPLSAAEEREVMRFLMAYQATPGTVGDPMDIYDEVEDAIDQEDDE